MLVVLEAGVLLICYAAMARDLPSPTRIAPARSTFQTTHLRPRGNLLNEAFDPNTGGALRCRWTPSDALRRQATIATEDANFYEHPGVDRWRWCAVYYAFQEGDVVSGGSTITQQLVKRVAHLRAHGGAQDQEASWRRKSRGATARTTSSSFI